MTSFFSISSAAGGYYSYGESALEAFAGWDHAQPLVLRANLQSGNLDLRVFERTTFSGFTELYSPYGYGGFVGDGSFDDGALNDLRAFLESRRVLGLFLRNTPWKGNHKFLPEGSTDFRGHVICIEVEGHRDRDSLLGAIPKNRRYSIRKAAERELLVEVSPLGGVSESSRRAFMDVYRATMARNSADESYFFNSVFINQIFGGTESSGFYVEVRLGPKTQLLAGAIFIKSEDDVWQYFLSASTIDGRKVGANDLAVFRAIETVSADGGGMLNLGGGLSGQEDDPLFAYKKSWGGPSLPFYTACIVSNRDIYERVIADNALLPNGRCLLGDMASVQ